MWLSGLSDSESLARHGFICGAHHIIPLSVCVHASMAMHGQMMTNGFEEEGNLETSSFMTTPTHNLSKLSRLFFQTSASVSQQYPEQNTIII